MSRTVLNGGERAGTWNRRVLQARANLNGGELDEGLPSDHIKKGRKDGALPRTGLNGGERGAVP